MQRPPQQAVPMDFLTFFGLAARLRAPAKP